MRTRRRDITVFSLSFLDCICCAFGAIILLFVLSEFAQPLIITKIHQGYQVNISQLQQELQAFQSDTRRTVEALAKTRHQLEQERIRLAELQQAYASMQGLLSSSKQDAALQSTIENRLQAALQELSAEMQRLLQNRPRPVEASVGGIPVDSEYIIFIIDTSGSMQRNAWTLVQKKMQETLKVYPKVKGIQVLNDMGDYMFPHYRGKWIPDTPARRKAILSTLRTWQPFSNSSPVEGITAAIRSFYSLEKKISLYVFGDEFSGTDIQPVIETVKRLNRAGRDGQRRVRIHGVGFPTTIHPRHGLGITGVRFATLMRTLCHANGGTFVGLNTTRP